jgi:hypothetical protein
VHGLTFNVQKLFMDMDARLWEECTQKHKQNMEKCVLIFLLTGVSEDADECLIRQGRYISGCAQAEMGGAGSCCAGPLRRRDYG